MKEGRVVVGSDNFLLREKESLQDMQNLEAAEMTKPGFSRSNMKRKGWQGWVPLVDFPWCVGCGQYCGTCFSALESVYNWKWTSQQKRGLESLYKTLARSTRFWWEIKPLSRICTSHQIHDFFNYFHTVVSQNDEFPFFFTKLHKLSFDFLSNFPENSDKNETKFCRRFCFTNTEKGQS